MEAWTGRSASRECAARHRANLRLWSDGPYREKAGFGTPATAFAGLTYLMGHEDRPPINVPIALADLVAGLYGALGAVMGLYWRSCTARSPALRFVSLVMFALECRRPS